MAKTKIVLITYLLGLFLLASCEADDYERLQQYHVNVIDALIAEADKMEEILRKTSLEAEVSVQHFLKPEELQVEPLAAEKWKESARNLLKLLSNSIGRYQRLYNKYVDIQYKLLMRFEAKPDVAESASERDSQKILSKRQIRQLPEINLPNAANELDSTKDQVENVDKFLMEEIRRHFIREWDPEIAEAIFVDLGMPPSTSKYVPPVRQKSIVRPEPGTEHLVIVSRPTKRPRLVPQTEFEPITSTAGYSSLGTETGMAEERSDYNAEYTKSFSFEHSTDPEHKFEYHEDTAEVPTVEEIPDYPEYEFIPNTQFTCSDKEYVPGFYADEETKCQVFHLCLPDRMKSFLCPISSVYNQKKRECDFWFNVDCFQSPNFYYLNQNLPTNTKTHSSKASNSGTEFSPIQTRIKYYSDSQFEEFYGSESNNKQHGIYKREASKGEAKKSEISKIKDQDNRLANDPLRAQVKTDRHNGLAYDPLKAQVKTDRHNGLAYDPLMAQVKTDRHNGLAYDPQRAQVKIDRHNDLAYDSDLPRISRSKRALIESLVEKKVSRESASDFDSKQDYIFKVKLSDLSKEKLERANGLAYDSDMVTVKLDKNRLAYDPDLQKTLRSKREAALIKSLAQKYKLAEGSVNAKFESEKDYILRKIKSEVHKISDLSNLKQDRANSLAYDPDLLRHDRNNGLAYDLSKVKFDRSNGLGHVYQSLLKLDRSDGLSYSAKDVGDRAENILANIRRPKRQDLETAREDLFRPSPVT